MPVEARPIFRPDVIRLPILGYSLPDAVLGARPKLEKWADLIGGGAVDAHKEVEILGDFLNDVFVEMLGYTRSVDDPKRYTFSREKHVQANGKFADAVLGEFAPVAKRYVAAVEGKGPKDPLDRPFAGRKVSAVDQAYDYAINLRCPWIVVTNVRQTRLYYKGADKQTYERFDTEALVADDRLLRKFVFLLHAGRMVPAHGPCHLDALLQDSEKVGREVTKEVYAEYAFIRRSTLTQLRRANPGVEPRLILGCAQKLLDRILFIAFCEDRGLLPPETIQRAHRHRDPYNPRPLWENFRGMFRAIDVGSDELGIRKYNGGLFADDPVLDHLAVPDEVFGMFEGLAAYDFRPASAIPEDEVIAENRLVDVEILGHLFEQSIDDLEKLQAELERPVELATEPEAEPVREKVSRRKREGAFYTPDYVTRYIVEQALGGVLRDRFERLRADRAGTARGTARSVLADPRAYDLDAMKAPQRQALLDFWMDWQQVLGSIRILDPACGSGAFLIEAFEQLHAAYQRANDRVQELRGHPELFDLDRKILQDNLYGVDLNDEAVHIARLSLWIKTAVKGKELTSLDHTLRVGNSVVADPAVDPRAFDWRAEFPEVFAGEDGGFDVVIGNPPYIRQEWLSPIKPYLQSRYAAYHGMADLYVYFYELGVSLLRPGGRMSYVVTNKWMKAGYGEPLRGFFAGKAWVESVVDFGHAKQIFPDADVFPSIIVVRRPDDGPSPEATRVCAIPRDQLQIDDLGLQIGKAGVNVPRLRLASQPWSLEPEMVNDLVGKIRTSGVPLSEFAGVKPYRGILTGLNEAFVIGEKVRESIIASDPAADSLIRPLLRGQDIRRWSPEWTGLWMIAIKSSGDHPWPWTDAVERAEEVFRTTYPGLHAHLKPFEDALRKRWDKGRFWWELRSCAYWSEFDKAKILYQDITWRASFCLGPPAVLSNDTTFSIPVEDTWLLAVLNSPVGWWYAWRMGYHGKDDALRLKNIFMEGFPVPPPPSGHDHISTVLRLIDIAKEAQVIRRDLLDWLRVEHGIAEPNLKLQSALELDSEAFVAEVRKLRGKKNPLSLAALKGLREEHARTIVPAQAMAREGLGLERRLSELVNAAYGLTPEEVALMWETAPPRMPTSKP